jgi:hypothetical protein
MVDMDNWQARLAQDMDFAKNTLIEHGEVRPMAVIVAKNGEAHVIALDMSSDDAKAKSLKFLRLMSVAHEAKAITTLGEMWMRSMQPYAGESPAEYEARVFAVRPREAEDRKEVVMVQLYYRGDDGGVMELAQCREIERGADGKPTGLAPAPDHEVLESDGPLTKLLPPHPPRADEVRYARELLDRLQGDGIVKAHHRGRSH